MRNETALKQVGKAQFSAGSNMICIDWVCPYMLDDNQSWETWGHRMFCSILHHGRQCQHVLHPYWPRSAVLTTSGAMETLQRKIHSKCHLYLRCLMIFTYHCTSYCLSHNPSPGSQLQRQAPCTGELPGSFGNRSSWELKTLIPDMIYYWWPVCNFRYTKCELLRKLFPRPAMRSTAPFICASCEVPTCQTWLKGLTITQATLKNILIVGMSIQPNFASHLASTWIPKTNQNEIDWVSSLMIMSWRCWLALALSTKSCAKTSATFMLPQWMHDAIPMSNRNPMSHCFNISIRTLFLWTRGSHFRFVWKRCKGGIRSYTLIHAHSITQYLFMLPKSKNYGNMLWNIGLCQQVTTNLMWVNLPSGANIVRILWVHLHRWCTADLGRHEKIEASLEPLLPR